MPGLAGGDRPPPPTGWRRPPPAPLFHLAAAPDPAAPSLSHLAAHRPLALLAVVPPPVFLFAAGAVAGALGKTLTAPLDRVKLLMQTGGGLETGAVADAARGGGLLRSLAAVGRDGGVRAYWRGNTPQLLKVVPYSAVQLAAYEGVKRALADKETGKLSVWSRLAAGAAAGAVATLATHPLDTLRLRMAVDPRAATLTAAAAALAAEGGAAAFYRGLGASVAGIAPYMALELAMFDAPVSAHLPAFARGMLGAGVATVLCYPLDTLRRRVQLAAGGGASLRAAAAGIAASHGVAGFYRGFLPNCLKNLPNKGVKMSVFDNAKRVRALAEDALQEERARVAAAAGRGRRRWALGRAR
jgi:solute carrier family 25 phosphate transporter 23/24/25/41